MSHFAGARQTPLNHGSGMESNTAKGTDAAYAPKLGKMKKPRCANSGPVASIEKAQVLQTRLYARKLNEITAPPVCLDARPILVQKCKMASAEGEQRTHNAQRTGFAMDGHCSLMSRSATPA